MPTRLANITDALWGTQVASGKRGRNDTRVITHPNKAPSSSGVWRDAKVGRSSPAVAHRAPGHSTCSRMPPALPDVGENAVGHKGRR